MENKPTVLLSFTLGGAEILCSKQLRLLRAYHSTQEAKDLVVSSDYKQDPEGYRCFGSYYIIEEAEAGQGLVLETSAGTYKW